MYMFWKAMRPVLVSVGLGVGVGVAEAAAFGLPGLLSEEQPESAQTPAIDTTTNTTANIFVICADLSL